MTNKTYIHLTR